MGRLVVSRASQGQSTPGRLPHLEIRLPFSSRRGHDKDHPAVSAQLTTAKYGEPAGLAPTHHFRRAAARRFFCVDRLTTYYWQSALRKWGHTVVGSRSVPAPAPPHTWLNVCSLCMAICMNN